MGDRVLAIDAAFDEVPEVLLYEVRVQRELPVIFRVFVPTSCVIRTSARIPSMVMPNVTHAPGRARWPVSAEEDRPEPSRCVGRALRIAISKATSCTSLCIKREAKTVNDISYLRLSKRIA